MKKFLVLIMLFGFTNIFAQTDSLKSKGFQWKNLDFNASYYGETGWYPGIKVGAEYIIFEKQKEKVKTKRKKGEVKKIKKNQFIITGNLGYYWQAHNYSSAFINSAVLYRHTGNKGFQYNFGISPLGINTFFFNETYKISDDDELTKAFLSARAFYEPSLIMGLGHTMKKKRLKAWFLNMHIIGLIPYNSAVNALLALEFGFRFDINRFNK